MLFHALKKSLYPFFEPTRQGMLMLRLNTLIMAGFVACFISFILGVQLQRVAQALPAVFSGEEKSIEKTPINYSFTVTKEPDIPKAQITPTPALNQYESTDHTLLFDYPEDWEVVAFADDQTQLALRPLGSTNLPIVLTRTEVGDNTNADAVIATEYPQAQSTQSFSSLQVKTVQSDSQTLYMVSHNGTILTIGVSQKTKDVESTFQQLMSSLQFAQ